MTQNKVSLLNHPKVDEMRALGIKEDHRLHMTLAVYLDMCEVQEWRGVQIHYSQELGRVYLTGHVTPQSPRQLVLPIDTGEVISHESLRVIIHSIKLDMKLDASSPLTFTLAISDPDSTLAYYTISDGLVKPDQTDALPRQRPPTTYYKYPLAPDRDP